MAWLPLLAVNFVLLGAALGSYVLLALGALLLVMPLARNFVNATTYDTLSFGEVTSIYQHLAMSNAACVVATAAAFATEADWASGPLALALRSLSSSWSRPSTSPLVRAATPPASQCRAQLADHNA
jgi:hypothetical protein